MKDFSNLGIKKEIVRVLKELSFEKPLEVQEKVVPLILSGKNIVFTSETGSGKTLAYLLGYIGKINKKLPCQMLIIVPTRELCVQVGKEAKKICELLDIQVGMVYGGREISGDYRTLNKKNQIIIATPGRLIQHINMKRLKVGDVRYIVFDESDQMFDYGFYDDCVYLIKRASNSIQIILSSATLTDIVKTFIEKIIGEHELLKIGFMIPKSIVQEKIDVEIPNKNELLLKVLKNNTYKKIMIFCNKKIRCYEINQFLLDNKIKSVEINAGLRQDERTNNLNLFKQGKANVLITTDVSARGIHIENVDQVINYDVPTRKEFYVHRIGRCGRQGKRGVSLTFICSEDTERFVNIEKEYEFVAKEVKF
jgi:ATP-dependent RNA helicase DeaD